jgi:glutamate--cysteine ligase
MDLKSSWKNKLESLSHPGFSVALQGILRGIEKEALRVNSDSSLASTAHPASLGSALTHSWITTDYAEALMEFITPVGADAKETLAILTDIHRHIYRNLGDELLWPASMPCTITSEDDIELAYYGASNIGKMKTIYRRGLKNRYGSLMQTIAGVHYNFSMPDSFWPVWQQIKGDRQQLPDFISESYLGLIRNFLRFGWLLPYLFGASPAVDSTFVKHVHSALPLKTIGKTSHYLPMATSLRMSELGYNSTEQTNLAITYNSLPEFVCGLRKATRQSNPVFEKIGLLHDGEYQQLNTNTLQEESELYAPIRPKRVAKTGEKLSDALEARGIEYVEVRSLDINPYTETGIDLEQVYFLDVFLTYCLLKDSPELSGHELQTSQNNLKKVATCGRELTLELLDFGTPKSLKSWAEDIFSDLTDVARLLDTHNQQQAFQNAINYQHQKLTNPALTPSARMLQDMIEQKVEVNELVFNLAKEHRQKLLETDYTHMQARDFALEAAASRQKQQVLEEADTLLFDDFLHLSCDSFPSKIGIPCKSTCCATGSMS